MKKSLSVAAVTLLAVAAIAQQQTYCNPINIDYGYCPIPDFVTNGKHRTTADPAIVMFRGDHYPVLHQPVGLLVECQHAALPRHFLKPDASLFNTPMPANRHINLLRLDL
jgi:hypothetical protein